MYDITLMMNGEGVMSIKDGKYYITNDEWGCYQECSRKEFIEELKNMSWVCLTSWDSQLRQDYLDLVKYTWEIDK